MQLRNENDNNVGVIWSDFSPKQANLQVSNLALRKRFRNICFNSGKQN